MSLFKDLDKELKEKKELAKLIKNKFSFTDLNNNKLEISSTVINDKHILFLSVKRLDPKTGKEESIDLAFSEDYVDFLVTILSVFKEDGNIIRVINELNKISD